MLFRQHILIVTNALSTKDAEQIKQTIALYPSAQIKLSLIYVMPKISSRYYPLPSIFGLKSKKALESKQHLQAIAKIMGIREEDQWINTGKLKIETQRLAQRLNVDVVVSNSLASSNPVQPLDPILTKKVWRQSGKISSRKFKDYLTNLAACTIPAIMA